MKTVFAYILWLPFFVLSYNGHAQLFSVSGSIKNLTDNNAVIAASVLETFSNIGTISDQGGHYRLMLSPGKHRILISSPGYKEYSTNFILSADTVITINLMVENATGQRNITADNPVENDNDRKKSKIHNPRH